MNRSSLRWAVLTLISAAGISGCVQPGHVDADDVYRLQQAMLARSPQPRSGEGLGPYEPAPRTAPALPIVEDPKSKEKFIPLTLQDAITRALLNNPEIAVASFSPQIERERVVEAAAAFDYTIFGTVGYRSVDSPRNHRTGSINLPPISKDRTIEFGMRQKTVTGAEWSLTNTMVRSWDNATTDSQNRWYSDDLALQVTQPLLRGAWPDVNLAEVRVARLSHRISLVEFRAEVERVVVEVAAAYWRLAVAQDTVDIVRRLLDATEGTYKTIKARADIGETAQPIAAQSLAALRTRQAVLVQTLKSVEDVQDELVRLLADPQLNVLSNVRIVPITPMPETPVTLDEADQLMTALRLNPSLEQLRLSVRQQDIAVRVAKNDMLPKLDLIAGTTLSGASRQDRNQVSEDIFSGDYASYEAALVFEYPLGNRASKARHTQTLLQRRQTLARMQVTTDQIAQQIAERIRQIESRFQELKIETEALDANKAYLDGLIKQENEGAAVYTPEWLNLKLNAQAAVATSEQSVLNARMDYNTAMWDLWRTTGSVLEMNQVKLALPVASQPADYSPPADPAEAP